MGWGVRSEAGWGYRQADMRLQMHEMVGFTALALGNVMYSRLCSQRWQRCCCVTKDYVMLMSAPPPPEVILLQQGVVEAPLWGGKALLLHSFHLKGRKTGGARGQVRGVGCNSVWLLR